jgi:endoglucanase
MYDPVTDTFATYIGLPQGVVGASVAALPGGDVALLGGATTSSGTQTGSAWLSDAWVWHPPAPETGAEILQPWITGTVVVGGILRVANNPIGAGTLSYQWQRCAGTCIDIGGPENIPAHGEQAIYSPSTADIGARIQVVVTVAGSSVSATTPRTDPVPRPGIAFESSAGAAVVTNGTGTVTITRGAAGGSASVDYTLTFPTAGPVSLYPPVRGTATFLPGSNTAAITFPATDHGVRLLSDTVDVALSNPSSSQIAGPADESFPLYPNADPATLTRTAANPLGLVAGPGADPLAGASFFVDHGSLAARLAARWRASDPSAAALLDRIAQQPSTARFGAWNGAYPGQAVAAFLQRVDAEEPGTIPMLSTYRIVDGQCRGANDTAAAAAAYATWIRSFAEGIGTHPAVLFLEMDSLITSPCLARQGLAIRLGELRDAVDVLADDPHLLVYLDAGAADALGARRAARLLTAAGVAHTQGFYLNSTHFDWTRREIAYGERISRLTGGKHFVVNTAENGQGPLVPRDRAVSGNEILCNPPRRGLGPDPTADTGFAAVDAFAWIANPGVSGGPCRAGAPSTGRFWPAQALSLAEHADPAVR